MRHSLITSYPSGTFAPVLSLEELSAVDPTTGETSFDISDPAPGPEQQCERREDALAVHKFVDALTPREREIVRRVFWLDEAKADVARDLKVSRMAVGQTITRITRRARIALADHEHLAVYD